jgi:glucoamylase
MGRRRSLSLFDCALLSASHPRTVLPEPIRHVLQVIVGFNDGFDASDNLFAPTSLEVASTVASYNTLFCSEYAINTADTGNGVPGVLYGRYGGDTYAGGNPWILSTAALASVFYRGAIQIASMGAAPSSDALQMWSIAMNATSLPSNNPQQLAAVFAAQGDGVLLRLRTHVVQAGFHLNEQLDRNTGAPLGANDLTWSYAEVLNAMQWRAAYLEAAAVSGSR